MVVSKLLTISAIAAFISNVEYLIPKHIRGPCPKGKNLPSSRNNFKSAPSKRSGNKKNYVIAFCNFFGHQTHWLFNVFGNDKFNGDTVTKVKSKKKFSHKEQLFILMSC